MLPANHKLREISGTMSVTRPTLEATSFFPYLWVRAKISYHEVEVDIEIMKRTWIAARIIVIAIFLRMLWLTVVWAFKTWAYILWNHEQMYEALLDSWIISSHCSAILLSCDYATATNKCLMYLFLFFFMNHDPYINLQLYLPNDNIYLIWSEASMSTFTLIEGYRGGDTWRERNPQIIVPNAMSSSFLTPHYHPQF